MKSSVDLARKLGLRPGLRVCLLKAPKEAAAALRRAGGAAVQWSTRLGRGRYDLIFFWPTRLESAASTFDRLERHLVSNGAIWAVMPKQAHAAARGVDFSWEGMQAEGLRGNLVDNKVASITDTDYGTRFVIRRERRQAPPRS